MRRSRARWLSNVCSAGVDVLLLEGVTAESIARRVLSFCNHTSCLLGSLTGQQALYRRSFDRAITQRCLLYLLNNPKHQRKSG